ncbi:MAG TPA: PKD domain-containing protein [Verrucomicrobiae bacterium]|nr:PKD domain-containing protein [Verrucomicrobiae bacterium]
MPRRIYVIIVLLCCSQVARATVITNTRPEIAQMAGYWEVDSVQISPLANSLYPQFTNTWEFMQPSGSTATDGDEHFNMAQNASGTGATGGNAGESPIVAEIINVSSTVGLVSSGNQHAKTRGIFRYYHEHAGELKYEIHPMTEIFSWSGSAFVLLKDCRPSFKPVADATTKAYSTYNDMALGNNQTVTAQVMADNNHVIITYPTGAGVDLVNYMQYDGQVVQTLTNDLVSPYITFRPTNCPASPFTITGGRAMRCRIVTNTVAARVAVGLISNQTVTVNILNRVDMLGISNIVASLSANQSTSFVQPIDWITLGLTNMGPVPPPVVVFTGSPTNGPVPLTVTFTDTSTGSITNRFWTFGDGAQTNIQATSVQHIYNSIGTNTVQLIVTGLGAPATNTQTGYIVVTSAGPPPPSASFTGSPTTGIEPLSVTFTDTSTGTITGRSWDFGDTITTNVITNSVSHTYAAGTYGVTLVVAGPGGVSTNSQLNYITALTAFQGWQVQYFGSTTNPAATAGADPDGDGQNNLAEFLTGTDPTNSASVFHIIAVTPQGGDILVTWATAGGKTNVVQVNGGDVGGSYTTNFIDLSPFIIIPGSGDVTTNYLDAGGATNVPSHYYRVRLVP